MRAGSASLAGLYPRGCIVCRNISASGLRLTNGSSVVQGILQLSCWWLYRQAMMMPDEPQLSVNADPLPVYARARPVSNGRGRGA
jgi:hypothetical protein